MYVKLWMERNQLKIYPNTHIFRIYWFLFTWGLEIKNFLKSVDTYEVFLKIKCLRYIASVDTVLTLLELYLKRDKDKQYYSKNAIPCYLHICECCYSKYNMVRENKIWRILKLILRHILCIKNCCESVFKTAEGLKTTHR